MDITDNHQSSQCDDALKLFETILQEQTLTVQGIPGMVMTMHRGKCSTCGTYAAHIIAATKNPTIDIPSHQIKVVFQDAWQRVVKCIEEAIEEACSKLSWYRN